MSMTETPYSVISNEENQFSSLDQDYLKALEGKPAYFLPDRISVEPRNITIVSEEGDITLTLSTQICGLPGFCAENAYNACISSSIISCGHCGVGRAYAHLLSSVVLALFIFIGNLIVIIVTKHRYHNKTLNKTDLCRTSLAAADLLIGFNYLITIIYNFSWTIHKSSIELDISQLLSRDSSRSLVGGLTVMYGFGSSIYHLLYMTVLRLYAIKRPVQYKILSVEKVQLHLLAIWIFNIVSSTIPMWFPGSFTYSLHTAILLFYPATLSVEDTSFVLAATLLVFSLALPFTATIIALVTSGLLLRKKNQWRDKHLTESNLARDRKRVNKRDTSSYQTLAVMLVGFTIPPIPLITIAVLHLSSTSNCLKFPRLFLIGVNLTLATSFINVIIYSAMDKSFRKAIRTISRKMTTKFHSFDSNIQRNVIAMVVQDANKKAT